MSAETMDPPRPPKTPRLIMTIRFPVDLVEELRLLAEEHNRSMNGTVVEACKRYVRQMRPRTSKDAS